SGRDAGEADGTGRAAKRFPEGHLQRARFERVDPSRASTVSSAREQRALEHALDLDPRLDAARLRLYEIMLGRGDDDEVAKALDKLPAWRLSGLEGRMLRYRVHRAAGNDHLAEAVLAEAARTYPKNCKVLVAQRSVARGRDDVR